MAKTITTRKDLDAAIRKARMILVQPRFGVVERWTAITKAEARNFIAAIQPDDTPANLEMFGGQFGELADNGTLYLG
jgi:hypothetical protein